jgi:hypothetical protein
MATFRCLQSGNTVTFTLQHDIDSMRGHSGYVRVDEDEPAKEFDPNAQRVNTPFTAPQQPPRPRGRPRKEFTL